MKSAWAALGLALYAFSLTPASFASQSGEPMHWGSDHTKVYRKTKKIELRGNAFVNRNQEVVRADEIDLDQEQNTLQARGHVFYQFQATVIQSERMDLDLKTGVGVIYQGSLSDGSIALRGQEIHKIGEGHYLVKSYEYTTCHDCPNSWSLYGDEVDLTLEGYAFIKDFIFKVKDASLFWFPYVVFPMKTRRQSGFLFPRFGVNEAYGFYLVEPYFWAINRWSDMTFGVGTYTERGLRLEWEGRYQLTPRSGGRANVYWTKDSTVSSLRSRYGAKWLATQEAPFRFETKLKLYEFSDSGYPIEFMEDIPGRYEPTLSSELFFSRNDPTVSTALSLKRTRNLLYFDANKKYMPGFDTQTVQEFPKIIVNTNDQILFDSHWVMGMEARFNRFARAAGPIDEGTTSTGDSYFTIRKANRLALLPKVYTSLQPVSWLSLTPSVQYRAYFYNFNSVFPNLARGYLLTQAELGFQLERVFRSESTEGYHYKHVIRPSLVYSVIPTIQESSHHPFVSQIQTTIRPGQYFDNADLVPLRSTQNLDTYVTPLGHSLTYGVVSQLFKKNASQESSNAKRVAELNFYQTWDINEFKRKGIDLSPLQSQFLFEDYGITWNTEYAYFYYLDRYTDAQLVQDPSPHRVSSTLMWTWQNYYKNRLLWFQRSISVGYSFSKLTSKVSSLRGSLNFSLNDYLMPQLSLSYDLASETKALLESRYGILIQNPSQCWRLETALTQSIDRGYGFIFNFTMNLLGNSFDTLENSLRF